MNWKSEAVEKLRRYDAMQRSLSNIPLEIKRLREEASAVSSGLAVCVGSGHNIRRQEEMLMNNLVKRQQLQWSLEQAEYWTQTVSRALSALEPDERLVLQRLYILPQSDGLEQLMAKLGVEKTSIYRRRDKALRKFTLSLYGTEESN